MMDTPLVSIIIPLYNCASYVAETIRSAMAQTWPHTEVIIVDDGSADDSLAIAKTFESDTVKVFAQPNAGASAARNKGLAEAKGDYIQFLDADDVLSADKIEKQLNVIKNIPGAMAYCRYGFISDGQYSEPTSYLSGDFASGQECLYSLYGGYSNTHTGGMVPLHCWLTPQNIINKAGPWNQELSVDDDGEYFCRVVMQASRVIFTDKVVAYYRKHAHQNNLSAQSDINAYRSRFKAIILKQKNAAGYKDIDRLFANQAINLMHNIYPNHLALRKEIEEFIKHAGGNTWWPYEVGLHKVIRKLFGWKVVRLLSYYKHEK